MIFNKYQKYDQGINNRQELKFDRLDEKKEKELEYFDTFCKKWEKAENGQKNNRN